MEIRQNNGHFWQLESCHQNECNVSIKMDLFTVGRAEITPVRAMAVLAHPWLRACSPYRHHTHRHVCRKSQIGRGLIPEKESTHGPMVIILATGSKVRRFKPGQGRWIFSECKNSKYDFLRNGSKDVGLVSQMLILQPFCCFTYITACSVTLLLLYLCHSSFSNPLVTSSTSQALHLLHLASHP